MMLRCPNPNCTGKELKSNPRFEQLVTRQVRVRLDEDGTTTPFNEEVLEDEPNEQPHCYYCGALAEATDDEDDEEKIVLDGQMREINLVHDAATAVEEIGDDELDTNTEPINDRAGEDDEVPHGPLIIVDIFVEGGAVQGVRSTSPGLRVRLFDKDDEAAGDPKHRDFESGPGYGPGKWWFPYI